MSPISVIYSNENFIVPVNNEGDSLYQESYGTRLSSNILTLDPCEVLFLVERGKIIVIDEDSQETKTFQELLRIISEKNEKTWIKYVIYRDLKIRGFVARLNQGKEITFNLYERGAYLKKPPKFIVYVITEGEVVTLENLIKFLHDTKENEKEVKLAVIDRRGEIVYYNLSELNLNHLTF
ncbi:hypothetical protein JW865_00110 [Candidatus Bathyarchaeota archaeon]|nr:hypothetical protein [Candidatus Bathyarchaeota archaeon]